MSALLPLNALSREEHQFLGSKRHPLPACGYLYQQGDRSTELYWIRAGIVCLESVNERGERCILHFLGQGAVLGHETFLKQPRTFDARACTDALVEVIAPALAPDPSLCAFMMRRVHAAAATPLQDAARFKVDLHRAQATEKVILLLKHLRKLHPEKADAYWLPSRNDMADILDINHATASRVVARLFREGALRRTASKSFVQVDWSLISRLRRGG